MSQWTGVAGKRVIVTGATRGIGLAAAQALAARGAELTIVARDPARARAAVDAIAHVAPDAPAVDILVADLALLSDLRRLADDIRQRYSRIDVLINNAGALYTRRRLTADGVEQTWAVNHVAPFVLTTLLLDRLKTSAPARIITTSSAAHARLSIPFDDLTAERGLGPLGFRRYGQTKLANILFTSELARRLEGSGVTANCFHPGFVRSGFNRNNGTLVRLAMSLTASFARTPERGADTLVWLADAPDLSTVSGGYFVDRRLVQPSQAARDLNAARTLWRVTEQMVDVHLPSAATRR